MHDHESEQSRPGEDKQGRVCVAFDLTEQQADLLDAAIARGDFKAFGIVTAKRLSPETTSATLQGHLKAIEQLQQVEPTHRDL